MIATNPYEVVFTFATPYFDPVNLAGSMLILSKHFYEKYSPEDFNKSTGLLMGSNAYKMEDPTGWVPASPPSWCATIGTGANRRHSIA